MALIGLEIIKTQIETTVRFLYEQFLSKKVVKSNDWLKKHYHSKWKMAYVWNLPIDDAPNIVHTTKTDIDHNLQCGYQYQ